MKTLKLKPKKFTTNLFSIVLILTVITLFISGKPVTNEAKKSAKEYVNKLMSDIQLTENQNVTIETFMAEFFTDLKVANSKLDKSEKRNLKSNIYKIKKNIMDSILTSDQKLQLEMKGEMRKKISLEKK